MSASSADRNLLFGLLALQMNFVSRDQLLDAMHDWMARKHVPLADVLQARAALAPEDRSAIDQLLQRHLVRCGGDARQGLSALSVQHTVRSALEQLTDEEVQHSVAILNTPPDWAPPTSAPAPSLPPPPPGLLPPGPTRYRKLREHARGGIGEVFLAQDEELGRQVALKEIQREYADHAYVRARFIREAEVTGHLEHPGIVPIHGLGRYQDGRPYYAMRFIRGESFQEAINRFHQADREGRHPGEREISLRSLLSRFVAVCNAVAYAHSRGIVHRDLKPANVMLGEFGETLVVDWGFAKSFTIPEEATVFDNPVPTTHSDSTPTQFGEVVGTRAFMPPEQARGELDRIDPRSDVFALGAMLYCLLTGRPPYEGDDVLGQARRGQVVPARQRNRRVPLPLEAVCARAMAERPADRYSSVRELASDVERWLADEPVRACPEPWRERARRWGKRNRALVSSGAVILVVLAIGLAVGLGAVRAEQGRTERALWAEANQRRQAETNLARAEAAETRAKEHLHRAEANFALARKAVDDCYGLAHDHPLFKASELNPDLRKAQKLLLEKALPFYQGFRAARPDAPDIQRELWRQHFHVARILEMLDKPREAMIESEKALDVIRRLNQTEPANLEYHIGLFSTLNEVGARQRNGGQGGAALRSFTESTRLARLLVQGWPEPAKHHALLASSLSNLAAVQADLDLLERAERSSLDAMTINRRLHQTSSLEVEHLHGLARTLNNLAMARELRGRPGLEQWVESLDLFRRCVRLEPEAPFHRQSLGLVLTNVARAYGRLGKREEAIRALMEAVEVRRQLAREYLATRGSGEDLAVSLGLLADELAGTGRVGKAIQAGREVVEMRRRLIQLSSEGPDAREGLIEALNDLARLQLMGKAITEALRSHEEIVATYRGLVTSHPKVPRLRLELAQAQTNYALLLFQLGRLRDALPLHREAVDGARELSKDYPRVVSYRLTLAVHLNNLAVTYHQLGQAGPALQQYTEAARVYRQVLQAHPREQEAIFHLASSQYNLADLLRLLNQGEQAVRCAMESVRLRRVLAQLAPSEGEPLSHLAEALARLAHLLEGMGRYPAAARRYGEVAETRRALLKHTSDPSAQYIALLGALLNRARLLAAMGQPITAGTTLEDAFATLTQWQQVAPGHSRIKALQFLVHQRRAELRLATGKPREALADLDQAERLALPGDQLVVRLLRGLALAHAGEHRQAAVVADTLAAGPEVPAPVAYDVACVFALSAAGAHRDQILPLPLRERWSEEHARRAILLLKHSAQGGFFDSSSRVSHLDKDSDLTFLRDRDDYRRFRAALAAGR